MSSTSTGLLADRRRDAPYTVGLVVPTQGPAGIFGPSCEAVADFAAHELNRTDGLLGRQVAIEVVDGGAAPREVARTLDALIRAGRIDAVTGWHISAVRKQLAATVNGRIPYVYTSLYEGGEQTRGVFCSGETPDVQLAPALRWLRDMVGVQSWCIVGNDYIWPRASSLTTRRYAAHLGLSIVDEVYVPLGQGDYTPAVDRVQRSGAEGALMFLVGHDAVLFNRAFARRGLHDAMIRFSPLMEENMLLASGARATRRLFVAASYFRSLATAGALDFMGGYMAHHGPSAPPLNNAAESCYEGITTLASLVEGAASTEVTDLIAVSDSVGYDGPRGAVHLERNHLRQRVYLALADGYEFDVLTEL